MLKRILMMLTPTHVKPGINFNELLLPANDFIFFHKVQLQTLRLPSLELKNNK